MAPAVSVVNSTSRVKSNRRVTSLRRPIASRARSCAAADRLLAMTATTRNANSAIQFCGSAIVNVPTGGRKKKFNVSIATTDTTIAIRRRAMVAVPRTTRSNANATVVGLTSGSARSDRRHGGNRDETAEQDDGIAGRHETTHGQLPILTSEDGRAASLRGGLTARPHRKS